MDAASGFPSSDLRRLFAAAPAPERPALLAAVLARHADNFECIIEAGATRSIDEDAFVQGLLAALRERETNLPALRLLAWQQIRSGAYKAAKECLRVLIGHWPHIPDTRRELLRVDMLAPEKDGGALFALAAEELHRPLTRASYRRQMLLSRDAPVPEPERRALRLEIDHSCAEFFRTAALRDPMLPAANAGVLQTLMARIAAAGSIALVANGASLKGGEKGAEIDAHDLVIRCNYPQLEGFIHDVGRKTDIMFFNETLVDALPELRERAGVFENCMALALHPEVGDLHPPATYQRNLAGPLTRLHPKLRQLMQDFSYTRPTTGLMGLILVSVVLGKPVRLYGFDFYQSPAVHYFPSHMPVFLGHELAYERWFAETFLPSLEGAGEISHAAPAAQPRPAEILQRQPNPAVPAPIPPPEPDPAPLPDGVHRYDGASMADPAPDAGLLRILEAPQTVPRLLPEQVRDLSGRGLKIEPAPELEIHGSYLVQREHALLFGPNHLITRDGSWSCEDRGGKRQWLWYMDLPFYNEKWPGPKPEVDHQGPALRLRTGHLRDADIIRIDAPVFLATALEPPIWGRWIASVAAKAAQFRQYGAGRKFLCALQEDWQLPFLSLFGIGGDMLLRHDPGRSYICRDVMTVELSVANMTVSPWERMNFIEMVALHQRRPAQVKPRLFVSRLTRSRGNSGYRMLQNEAELAAMLEALGFATIEPEQYTLPEQMGCFAAAEEIVFLGGSAVFNSVFCAPGTSVMTIESSDTYIAAHTALFASLGLRHAVLFGAEDPDDPAQWHKRWSIDIAGVRAAVREFFGPPGG